MISIESLVFSFREQNLFQEFNLHYETYALRSAKVTRVSDSDILKNILPPELSSKMFGSGNLNLLAFIFALRHKILLLNSLFHLSALKNNNHHSFTEVNEEFCSIFGEDFFNQYNNLLNMLMPPFWGKAKQLPILGFSAVGCHFVMRDISLCRAFDAYNLPYCNQLGRGVFCERHSIENYWKQKVPEEASVQAKLAQFYINPANFSQFDEDSLKRLIQNFFRHFERSQNESFKVFLDSTKLNFLLELSEILRNRINQKEIVHDAKFINNSISRCSYKFCNYKDACVYNYNLKNKSQCYQDHYVHRMVSADLSVLIDYIKSKYSELKTIIPNKEILKSINTLSYVINHMETELKSKCMFLDENEWEKNHFVKNFTK
jgi:hypothetical protein